ncbi:polysaccharide deacetylase family protein [Romboutsia sp.]|uniref:polysaccharide deacetylase family protein n=1 Tax=Romboutsia sp. TaxID=1965302 RepID=UPI003F2E73F2
MKRKSNHFILAIIIGLILSLVVLGVEFLIKEESNERYGNRDSEIYKVIQMKTLTELIYEASSQIYKGPGANEGKIAYITIDDGPSKYTNQILDILDRNNVKATFFMLDGNMKKRPNEVERIALDGQGVGFHSVSHDIRVLYKTPEITLEEFDTCKETYKNITGKESKLIRLPYGSKPYTPENSYKILVDNNYLMWDWNLDTEDWRATTDKIVSNVLYYGRNRSNLVVLIHEKEQSVKALEGVIKVLKNRGYVILPIDENTQPLNYWSENL